MEWRIKRFYELSSNELYDILEARIDVFVTEQNCAYKDVDGKDKKSTHIFALDGDKIVAYARILDRGVSYDEVSIGRVLVTKKYRGMNYGEELMKKAIKYIEEEMNEEKIHISAQTYLEKFYKKLGFKIISDKYMDVGIEHFEMIKE